MPGPLGPWPGNALWQLGERESGTARLEEAVTAYRAALQEWTRERAPLDWASATGNQGVALLAIAERQRNVQVGKQALSHLTAAFEMLRDAGHASHVHYARLILEAQTLVEQLGNEGPQT